MVNLFVTLIVAMGAGVVLGVLTKRPKLGILPVPLILVAGMVFSSQVIIYAGNVGVVTRFGATTGRIVGQGLHVLVPFVEEVHIMNVQTKKEEQDAEAASKDLQTVHAKIAVNYHLDASEAETVYRQIGTDFKKVVVDPAIQESFKASTARFTAEELITQREEVRENVAGLLEAKLARFNIILDEVNLTNFDFSKEFNAAIESKQVAQQNVQKAKQDLERAKIEAQQKIEEAKGNAEAQRLQQSSLTEIYVQFKALEKWDGKLPQYTTGNIPFIGLSPAK